MSNITLPPQKKTVLPADAAADEKKISAVINKGGSTTKTDNIAGDVIKHFNIKLLERELTQINELRRQRPKPRGQKSPGITLHAWILEAVQEKIESETKQYDTEVEV